MISPVAAEQPRVPVAASTEPTVVALVGNPNTGKTALFNALTGFQRHVANYPGVTVDVGRGPIRHSRQPLELLDLPGTYSLAAAAPDEMVLCNAVSGRAAGCPRPSLILAIVDASNPLRNLYLLSQVLELRLPVVVALNMVDIAHARGIEIDAAKLSKRLGVPVVPVIATQEKTVEPLVRALESAIGSAATTLGPELPAPLWDEARALSAAAHHLLTPGEALRVLVDVDGHAQRLFHAQGGNPALLAEARGRIKSTGLDAAPAEVRARYAWINRVLDGVVERRLKPGNSFSDRLDRVLTHRVAGLIALLAVLYAVFYSIYAGAAPLMDLVDMCFRWLGQGVTAVLPAGMVQSLIVDGLLAGVGAVIAFLPQIVILFVFIALLEDCGYLSRAAFLVDRLMRPLGLSGRSFIPLLSGFACAVPAILGTRAIADRRERTITILMIPFMSCSARLPVYLLMTAAFVPRRAWLGGWLRLDALVLLAMYFVGVIVVIPIALALRKTVFAGSGSGFLLELPGYKRPRLRTVYQRVRLAARSFLVRAGTIILAVNILIWALGYFPRNSATLNQVAEQRAAQHWNDTTYESELAGAYLRSSFLGRLGQAIEPTIKPLGWDWRIGLAVVASFPAREQIIASLGTVFNLGRAAGSESASLRTAVQQMKRDDTGGPLFTLPVALSLMVFFALCAQCGSTLVMIGRETGSWVWPVVSFLGMTTLAYGGAWAVFVGARAVGL